MTYACCAEDDWPRSACHEHGLPQCGYCADYQAGKHPPLHPVPAIREYFEFSWSLSDNEPVLMHVVQGPYSD